MKIFDILRDERGQLVPFISISLIIVMLFSALGLGLTSIYRDRTRIRDALDAAASAAITTGARANERATYLYEELICVKRSKLTGRCVSHKWVKREKDYEPYITIDENSAKKAAQAYFDKNMRMDGLEYKIKDWDIEFRLEPRRLQVHIDRPNTEERIATYLVDFPRYVEVTIDAQVETSVPMGKVVEYETVKTRLSTKQLIELD